MVENIFEIDKHHILVGNDIMCIMVKGKWNLLINKDTNNNYELIIADIGERNHLAGEVDMNTISKDILDYGNNNVYSRIMFKIIGNWNNSCLKRNEMYNKKDDPKEETNKINEYLMLN